MSVQQLPAPSDLDARGRTFWDATVAVFELTETEVRVLHEACRVLDELDRLHAAVAAEGVTSRGSAGQPVAHPALAALTAHRGMLGRLLGQLNLPHDDTETTSTLQTPAQVRARRAAQVRWARHRAGQVS